MAEEADRSRDILEWVYEYFHGGSGQTVSQLVEYSIMNDLEIGHSSKLVTFYFRNSCPAKSA